MIINKLTTTHRRSMPYSPAVGNRQNALQQHSSHPQRLGSSRWVFTSADTDCRTMSNIPCCQQCRMSPLVKWCWLSPHNERCRVFPQIQRCRMSLSLPFTYCSPRSRQQRHTPRGPARFAGPTWLRAGWPYNQTPVRLITRRVQTGRSKASSQHHWLLWLAQRYRLSYRSCVICSEH